MQFAMNLENQYSPTPNGSNILTFLLFLSKARSLGTF
jgi:hypothetical protein